MSAPRGLSSPATHLDVLARLGRAMLRRRRADRNGKPGECNCGRPLLRPRSSSPVNFAALLTRATFDSNLCAQRVQQAGRSDVARSIYAIQYVDQSPEHRHSLPEHAL